MAQPFSDIFHRELVARNRPVAYAPWLLGRVSLSHRSRPTRGLEGADGAGGDALGRGLQADDVRRHRRLQPARRRALRRRQLPCAEVTIPSHHAPRFGRQVRANQRRRASGAQAQEPSAKRHHALGDVAAGVHAADGGPGATHEAAPDSPPWRSRTQRHDARAGVAGTAQAGRAGCIAGRVRGDLCAPASGAAELGQAVETGF